MFFARTRGGEGRMRAFSLLPLLLLGLSTLVVLADDPDGQPSFHDQLAEERRLLEERRLAEERREQDAQRGAEHGNVEMTQSQDHQEAPPPPQQDVPEQQQQHAPQEEHHDAPPQEQHEVPPQEHQEAPPQEHHEAPPQEHHDAAPQEPAPQEHHEAPPQEPAPQEHHEAPPQEHHEALPQEHHDAPPQEPAPQEHHEAPPQEHHEAPPQEQHDAAPLQEQHEQKPVEHAENPSSLDHDKAPEQPQPAAHTEQPAAPVEHENQQAPAEPLVLLPSDSTDQLTPSPSLRPNSRHSPRSKTAPKHDNNNVAGYYNDDDYYGMNENPADHVDTAAFQPSHTLSLEIPAGTVAEFFEEVLAEDVGKVVRGDWFVTSGSVLDLTVVITGPRGEELYREGPTRTASLDSWTGATEPASEGSFHFYVSGEGVHRVALSNPSSSDSRTVSFAWLLGKDDDDAYVDDWDPRADDFGDASKNTTAFVQALMSRVSRVHKRIDEVISLQQFADVRFKRHLQTTESTHGRVLVWSLIETFFVLLVAVTQVIIVRRFDVKPAQQRSWV